MGTCTANTGVCTYSQTCTKNSDCAASQLCLSNTATDGTVSLTCAAACTPASGTGDSAVADNCSSGVIASDDVNMIGVCGTASSGVEGQCSFSSACTTNDQCVKSNFCEASSSTC